MLASVLNSPRAVQVSIGIVRVFVRLRAILSTHAELGRRLDELEQKLEQHDSELHYVFDAIRELMAPDQYRPSDASASMQAPSRASESLAEQAFPLTTDPVLTVAAMKFNRPR